MSAPLRSSLGEHNFSIPKQHIIEVSSGDENRSNESLNRGLAIPQKQEAKPALITKQEAIHIARPDNRTRPILEEREADTCCGIEVSVSDRRQWLQEFGMHHKASTTDPAECTSTFKHQVKTPPKAPRGTMTSTESVASTLVDRVMSSSRIKNDAHRGFNAPSFKPRIKRDEVQATNEGYASVAKLSEWLANDPTATKKKNYVRRGKNVVSKSRNYEKELENVIVIETNIPRGGVQDKKKMIQGAFGSPGAKYRRASNVRDLAPRYAVSDAGVPTISVSEKKDWLKKAFKHAIEDSVEDKEEARSEIIVNDAASSLSVSDKKDWLQNAFKNGKATSAVPNAGTTPSKKFGYGKAMTDVMHNRDADDDAKARIKARFVARSGRTPVKAKEIPVAKAQEQEVVTLRDEEKEERTGPPKSSESENRSVLSSESSLFVEEDQTPVDFRSARMALIHRGKQNGHEIQVVNKVYMKKSKFEQLIEAERKQRLGSQVLHKSSWEEADPSTGLPSTAYDKKLLPIIAPKKSFEELP